MTGRAAPRSAAGTQLAQAAPGLGVMSNTIDFRLGDLYAALDAERCNRGLSWSDAARQMAGRDSARAGHRLSISTITRTRTARVAEADGILQMLLWLDRSPESFTPGHPTAAQRSRRLPRVGRDQVLRFDTRAIHRALNRQRVTRGFTWTQVAVEIGVSASALQHLAKGGRTSFPQVMRITAWLERPAADFTMASDR